MNDEEHKKVSLGYYFGCLEDALEQENIKSAIYFLKEITKLQDNKIRTNRIILGLFTAINFIGITANAYFLLLK